MRLTPKSLGGRLFLFAAVLIVVALVGAGSITGLILYRFIQGQVDQRLDTQIAAISSALVATPENRVALKGQFDGPPFDRPGGGWYFEIFDGDNRIRSASLGRKTEQLDSHYAGRLQSLYATPILDLPWSLIVFRDKQILDAAHLEVVTLAVELFLLYGLALALVYIAAHLIGGRRFAAWLWPNEKRPGTYALLALVNLALALAFGAVIVHSDSADAIVVSALVFPVLGLLLTMVLLAAWGRKPGWLETFARLRRWRYFYRLGYVVSMSLLLLLLSVLPMMAFFKVAFDSELRLLARQAQLQLDRKSTRL